MPDPELAARAAELEMPAVALTDHGSLAGAVELYREARKQGVKPLLGCEVYVADDRQAQTKGYAHLTLLAESNEGYANLIKLSSLGYLEGYYYKPRVDWELLERHAKGLVASRAASRDGSRKALEESRPADAAADLDRLVQIFGRDSTYVEIQNAGLDAQARINPQLAEARRRHGPPARRHRRRPLPPPRGRARARGAALHPVRRLAEEPEPLEVRHRPVLLQDPGGDGASISPGTRTRWPARSRSPSAATSRSSSAGSCCRSSRVPEGRDAFEYLVELCEEGLACATARVTPELRERLQFELKTIREMGFADYFLIVWDFVRFAKRNGVGVGPGRGSAAGCSPPTASRSPTSTRCATACCSSASSTRPASTCPTWTSTSPSHGRDRVINYVAEKYGRDRVAQIITFGR